MVDNNVFKLILGSFVFLALVFGMISFGFAGTAECTDDPGCPGTQTCSSGTTSICVKGSDGCYNKVNQQCASGQCEDNKCKSISSGGVDCTLGEKKSCTTSGGQSGQQECKKDSSGNKYWGGCQLTSSGGSSSSKASVVCSPSNVGVNKELICKGTSDFAAFRDPWFTFGDGSGKKCTGYIGRAYPLVCKHNYLKEGSYTIQFHICDDFSSQCKTVTSAVQVTKDGGSGTSGNVDFSWSPPIPKAGEKVTFTSTQYSCVPGQTTRQWNLISPTAKLFSTTTNERTSTYTFDDAGDYQVKLLAKCPIVGSDTVTHTVTVTNGSGGTPSPSQDSCVLTANPNNLPSSGGDISITLSYKTSKGLSSTGHNVNCGDGNILPISCPGGTSGNCKATTCSYSSNNVEEISGWVQVGTGIQRTCKVGINGGTTPSQCQNGNTQVCSDSSGCEGTQVCVNESWGSCVKTDSSCGGVPDTCGNSKLDVGEVCDTDQTSGNSIFPAGKGTCQEIGRGNGVLGCTAQCQVITDGCSQDVSQSGTCSLDVSTNKVVKNSAIKVTAKYNNISGDSAIMNIYCLSSGGSPIEVACTAGSGTCTGTCSYSDKGIYEVSANINGVSCTPSQTLTVEDVRAACIPAGNSCPDGDKRCCGSSFSCSTNNICEVSTCRDCQTPNTDDDYPLVRTDTGWSASFIPSSLGIAVQDLNCNGLIAFGLENGELVTATDLKPGFSYLLRSSGGCAADTDVPLVSLNTINLEKGWNLKGSGTNINVADLKKECPGSIVIGLGAGGQLYTEKNTLEANKGYLIRTNGVCQLPFGNFEGSIG